MFICSLTGDLSVCLSVCLSLSLFNGHFSWWTRVGQYQNVFILDFVEAKDDRGGGDSWSYKTCKAPVKSSLPTNQHPVFFTGQMP